MTLRSLAALLLVFAATPAVPSGQQVYSAKDTAVKLPTVLERIQPRYTDEAWTNRIEPIIRVDCDVLPDGTVGAVMITDSTLDETYGLDQQAIKAIRQWKFRPGTKDGQPVAVRINIETKFTLARPRLDVNR